MTNEIAGASLAQLRQELLEAKDKRRGIRNGDRFLAEGKRVQELEALIAGKLATHRDSVVDAMVENFKEMFPESREDKDLREKAEELVSICQALFEA